MDPRCGVILTVQTCLLAPDPWLPIAGLCWGLKPAMLWPLRHGLYLLSLNRVLGLGIVLLHRLRKA